MENAAAALGDIIGHDAHVGGVVVAGGVAALIKVLRKGPEGVKLSAARALGHVIYHKEHSCGVVASGGVPT